MVEIKNYIAEAVKDTVNVDVAVELTRPDPKFGDVTTNVVLYLQKLVNEPPREIAQKIVSALKKHDIFTDLKVAGPGFINMTLSDSYLYKQLSVEPKKIHAQQKIVIETNNPNPFKAMHIGHAFNAIIADTIANLLDASGAEVHRVSYHGDVGSHVGKSMYSLLEFSDGDVHKIEQIPKEQRNKFMSQMYAKGAKAYKEQEKAKQKIIELAAQSHSPTEEHYRAVYDLCKKWSFEQIDDLVVRIGNKPIEKRYLEGQTQVVGEKIVKDNMQYFVKSEGAIIFPGSKYGSFDNVFVASTGQGLYGARDLGLIRSKQDDFNPKKSYIVTAEEQRDYFKGVTAAAGLCMPNLKDVTVNISTGTVKLTTGKMSSRSGDVVEVEWLLDQIEKAVKERGAESSADIVTGAIRYEFLKVRLGSDVVFDVNEAANIRGNSGPYLQYAHARACSILSKLDEPKEHLIDVLQTDEHALLLKLCDFKTVKIQAVDDLMPHHLCVYLYELTQEFNRFYERNRVVGDAREKTRALLLSQYRKILQDGLSILGIPAPNKM